MNPYIVVGTVIVGAIAGLLLGRLHAASRESKPACSEMNLSAFTLLGEQGVVFAYDKDGIPCIQDLRTRAWAELPLGEPTQPTKPEAPVASSTTP